MTTKPTDNEEATRFRGLHYIDLARAALTVKDYASANGYFCKAMHLNVEWPEEEQEFAKKCFRDFLSNTLEGGQSMVESPCYFVTLFDEVILAKFKYTSEGKQNALDFALKTVLSPSSRTMYEEMGIENFDSEFEFSVYGYTGSKVWLQGGIDYGDLHYWCSTADVARQTAETSALAVTASA